MPIKLRQSNLLRAALIFGLGLALLFSTARAAQPEDDIANRSGRFLANIPANAPGAYGAVARLAKDREVNLADIQNDLNFVNSRRDCSDFKMSGFLRLLYLYQNHQALPAEMRDQVRRTTLDFKYWIDEPGKDSMCYWSENHQVIFHSSEYLAGALFPDLVFSNSKMTGRQHMAKGRALLEQWLDWREKFGFSEWQSNVYYCEDLFALLNLVDFAPDPEIRRRAEMAVDQLALNMALNSYRGNFTTSHGRSYSAENRSARNEDIKQVMHLLWGVREFTPDMARPQSAAVALATSSYRLPQALLNLGRDTDSTYENYQALGLDLEDTDRLVISKTDLDTGMLFWGMGLYAHPGNIDLTARMWEKYDLYGNAFFLGLARPAVWLYKKSKLKNFISGLYNAASGAFLDNAHVYTYRTPEYILSTALDFHPGVLSSQVTVWQAGLGTDAVVYVTYPGSVLGGSPGYWQGNGSNPRAAQSKNVMIAIYNAPVKTAVGEMFRYPMTHAWFPKSAFDRVERKNKWTFGRKGKGYIGLYSANPVIWLSPSELAAPGLQNVWVCEMGSEQSHGSFEKFMDRLASAKIVVAGSKVSFASPSQGDIEFSWTGPFLVNGSQVPLRRPVRYDNPYVRAERYSEKLEIINGGKTLILDFKNRERISN